MMGLLMVIVTLMAVPTATTAQTVAKKTIEAKKEATTKKTKTATAAAKQQTAAAPATNTPAKLMAKPAKSYSKPAPSTAAAGNDKVIGKDDKGRTIYEGKRGGHYYINSNGNKTYIKKN